MPVTLAQNIVITGCFHGVHQDESPLDTIARESADAGQSKWYVKKK
jgi:hypothetical protein